MGAALAAGVAAAGADVAEADGAGETETDVVELPADVVDAGGIVEGSDGSPRC
jgi:hypothetical protein